MSVPITMYEVDDDYYVHQAMEAAAKAEEQAEMEAMQAAAEAELATQFEEAPEPAPIIDQEPAQPTQQPDDDAAAPKKRKASARVADAEADEAAPVRRSTRARKAKRKFGDIDDDYEDGAMEGDSEDEYVDAGASSRKKKTTAKKAASARAKATASKRAKTAETNSNDTIAPAAIITTPPMPTVTATTAAATPMAAPVPVAAPVDPFASVPVLAVDQLPAKIQPKAPESYYISQCSEFDDSHALCIAKYCGPNLSRLSLGHCDDYVKVTNLGLAAFAKYCPNITELRLSGVVNASSAGFVRLVKSLPHLRIIELNELRAVDDDVCIALGESCKNLEEAWLSTYHKFGGTITSKGLLAMSHCPRLRKVSLVNHSVYSDDKTKLFKKRLPRCEVAVGSERGNGFYFKDDTYTL
jgi:hypothetical protein